jgi:hypothetical protein
VSIDRIAHDHPLPLVACRCRLREEDPIDAIGRATDDVSGA